MIKVGVRNWVGLGMLLLVSQLHAQANSDMTTPLDPFRIAGNLYYVGSRDLASYLIVTPQGDILINSGFENVRAADPQQCREARLPIC